MNKLTNYLASVVLCLSMLVVATISNGQGTLKGRVIDEQTGIILPYASLQLFSHPDSTLLKGINADTDGKFRFESIEFGQYYLSVSYMGYEDRSIFISLTKKNQQHEVTLNTVHYALQEVEIMAEKKIVQNSLEKTTINISKNQTLTGSNAKEVMQSLPSVDIDIDGKIHYRGSDKVIILINGAQSELVSSLEQIPGEQIEKIEMINNPSAKFDAEGMSGIINIVLKKAVKSQRKTTFMLNAGYPETFGTNIGYSGNRAKMSFIANAAVNRQTKYQTKDHLRKNYEDPLGIDYHQFDRQEEQRNNALINSHFNYKFSEKQHLQLSIIGSSKFNSADRNIEYSSLDKTENIIDESLKNIDISLDNYHIDARLKYHQAYWQNSNLSLDAQYAIFHQLNEMNNEYFQDILGDNSELQNTYSWQHNKEYGIKLDNSNQLGKKLLVESGINISIKDLLNDFTSESFDKNNGQWQENQELGNQFTYFQNIEAAYINLNYKPQKFKLQAGIRTEWTHTNQNDDSNNEYLDFFPSINMLLKINSNFEVYTGYNRRINRPTIKMLNPYTYEYADLLNRHTGNPHLQPEYVNSLETGGRIIKNKWTTNISLYYRDINQAISRVKSAANDSALVVTFMNLEGAMMIGSELFVSYDPFRFWHINSSINLFRTQMNGKWENNEIARTQNAWNLNLTNSFKLPYQHSLQLIAYYRSKLPDVMGTYMERYYMDMAISKKILNNKGQLVFKISDVFNTYRYGLDLDAIDDDSYHYSQRNRRKNESQYFVLSFIYNISQKDKSKQKESFFLERFGK